MRRSWINRLFGRSPRTHRNSRVRCRPTVKALEDRLTPAYPAMTQLTGASNPFGAFDVGEGSAPALADMDGDGDLDAVSGDNLGSLKYFKNTGSAIIPVYTPQTGAYNAGTGLGNPFNGIVYSNWSTPALGDVDGDGDFDLVVGETNGTLKYYKNTGSTTAPAYTPQAGTFDTVDIGLYSAPTLADVNGDGRLDLFVGTDAGTVRYFHNFGGAISPSYTELSGSANPLNGFDVGNYAVPALGDMDGDGDLDAIIGGGDGALRYYRNTGTANSSVFTELTGALNPFNGFKADDFASPAFGDVDGDGDLDVLSGEQLGKLYFFRGDSPPPAVNTTGAGAPFNSTELDTWPALGDVDGDGDFDALVGVQDGTFRFFRNTGSATSPSYTLQSGSGIPFDLVDIGLSSTPAFADLDSDGDVDVAVGENDGALRYFKNIGSATNPLYSQKFGGENPFNTFDVGYLATPSFGDLDGDGDLDLVVGEAGQFSNPIYGQLYYFKNVGSATNPSYSWQTGAYNPGTGLGNPFNGFDAGDGTAPELGDIDGDGDVDLFVGSQLGKVSFYRNTGTATSLAFTLVTGGANPLNSFEFSGFRHSKPELVDMDADGDADAIVGSYDPFDSGNFTVHYYRTNRVPVLDNAIPDQTFTGAGTLSYIVPVNTFLDLDSNALTYTATLTSGAALPTWLNFNAGTRTFSGNPAPSAASPVQLRVIANDGNGASFSDDFQLTLINVSDPPTDVSLLNSSVAENQAIGTAVGTLSTTDGDSGDTFTYVLVPGTGSTDNASFTISGNTLKSAASFDLETKAFYSIRVRSTDAGGLSTEKALTVSVTNVNEAPTIVALLNSSVPENQSSGAPVGTLSTTDIDVGDTFAYTLVPGMGSTDNGSFTISGNTLKTAASFDYETKSFYSIRVRSTDAGGLNTEKAFTISVTNQNDSPTGIAISFNAVGENQPVNWIVGSFNTTDADNGDTFSYSLVSGMGSADNAQFAIAGSTLKTAASFDYETKSSYSIRVRGTDAGGMSTENIFSVYVVNLDEQPTDILLSNNLVFENQTIGTVVGALSTIDPDIEDIHTYALVAGAGGADNASFTISGNSLKTAANFDSKTQSSYSIRVKSTDAGGMGLSIEKALTINILSAFIVYNDADSGNGSFRQVVINANAKPGTDSITFDPAYFNVPRTIVLTTGELAVTDSVAIAGPAGGVAVSGNNASRLFNLDVVGTGAVTISDMTITAGKAAGGAGIFAGNDNLTLTRCSVSNNTSTDLVVQGGGVSTVGEAGTWTFTDSTFSGNTGGRGGAIYFFTTGTLNMMGCTVSGNKSTNVNGGGGLYNYQNTATIINSTFSGNQSAGGGGAIQLFAGAAVTVRNSTITGNTSATAGGGINQQYGANSLTLSSTIVAGNTAGSVPVSDLGSFGAVNVGGDNNLVGVMDPTNNVTLTGTGNLTGTAATPLDAKLNPLANNGGLTWTHAIVPASPAYNSGNNSAALSTDQRGVSRLLGGAVDIGAYEYLPLVVTTDADSGPGSLRQAILDANNLLGAETITFEPAIFATQRTIVLAAGELGITESLTITGPSSGVIVSGNNASRVFNLLIPDTGNVTMSDLTVTAGKTDKGAGIKANDDNLTLTRCTVSNNTSTDPNHQGGGVSTGVAAGTWTFTDSTFSGNTGARGGAIYFWTTGTLNMLNCTVSGNKATNPSGGGALYCFGNTATIVNSTISGNQAVNGHAGAIQIFYDANVTIRNSTITGNSATLKGGAISRGYYGSLTLSSTIVSGNTAGSAETNDLSSEGPLSLNGNNNLIGVMDPANNITLAGTGNLTGATGAPLDAKLGTLAKNGGPTMTHTPLAGSPALNAGNNFAALTSDQRGFTRVVGIADIGAVEVENLPFTVTKVEVNDGSSAQRSMVTSLKVTFSVPVSFPLGINAAFQLNRVGPGNPTGSVNLTAVLSSNIVTITFVAGGTVGVDPLNSLQDGAYQLVVFADKMTGNGGQTLDGGGNGLSGDNYSTPATGAGSIFRLFGDSDGNRTVDQADFITFRNAFNNGPSAAFDFDGDGQVSQTDFIQFRNRFNLTV